MPGTTVQHCGLLCSPHLTITQSCQAWLGMSAVTLTLT